MLTITNAARPHCDRGVGDDLGAEDVVLDRFAGIGSIIGTCLWAAAWKTTCGRSAQKNLRRCGADLADVGDVRPNSAPTQLWRSSRSISNSAFSALSSKMRRCGQNRMLCRQISEPMLPPAPVTRITLPARKRCNSGVSRLTGLRPSNSAVSSVACVPDACALSALELLEPSHAHQLALSVIGARKMQSCQRGGRSTIILVCAVGDEPLERHCIIGMYGVQMCANRVEFILIRPDQLDHIRLPHPLLAPRPA